MNEALVGIVQTLFDAVPEVTSPLITLGAAAGADGRPNEAKRSISYMVDAALNFGKLRGLDDLLDSVAGFRQYKPYNALLVLLQVPGATYVLPAHVWGEKYGRVILPGEQPLVMLQPGGPVMFLFDVSQTEEGPVATPLPIDLQNPFGMLDIPDSSGALAWVIQNAKADGVRVSDAGLGLRFAGCIQRSESGLGQRVEVSRRPPVEAMVKVQYDVLLNKAYSPTEQLATLAHELGHLYCGHLGAHVSQLLPDEELWADRSQLPTETDELEAQSVARIVVRSLAPQDPLPTQLAELFASAPELLGMDLDRVLTAAGRVLAMADGFAPRRPRQKHRQAVQADSV